MNKTVALNRTTYAYYLFFRRKQRAYERYRVDPLASFAVDHVDGVRQRLWTTATDGPVCPPGDIWACSAMVEWCRQGTTPCLSTRAPRQSYQQSHIVGKQGEIMDLALRSILVHTSKGSWTCRIIWRQGLTAVLPFRRKERCRILSPLKIHRPRPVLNPRTLVTIASTLTSRPLKTTRFRIIPHTSFTCHNDNIQWLFF
jgi:hypothetical protein